MPDRTSNIISVAVLIIMLILTIINLAAKSTEKLEPRVDKIETQCNKNTTDIAVTNERWLAADKKLDEIKQMMKDHMEKSR